MDEEHRESANDYEQLCHEFIQEIWSDIILNQEMKNKTKAI